MIIGDKPRITMAMVMNDRQPEAQPHERAYDALVKLLMRAVRMIHSANDYNDRHLCYDDE